MFSLLRGAAAERVEADDLVCGRLRFARCLGFGLGGLGGFGRSFVLGLGVVGRAVAAELQAEADMRIGEAGQRGKRDGERGGYAAERQATENSSASRSTVNSQNWCCSTIVISRGYCERRRGGTTTPGWS